MQTAFVPNRLITDNALIAFECLHAIKNGGNGSKKFCVYKLDLNKRMTAWIGVFWKVLLNGWAFIVHGFGG
jgi:hypothetical protein